MDKGFELLAIELGFVLPRDAKYPVGEGIEREATKGELVALLGDTGVW